MDHMSRYSRYHAKTMVKPNEKKVNGYFEQNLKATIHLNSTCPSSLKRRPTALKTTTPIFIFCTIFH
ncbi:hypothetical protein Bca4012_050556 [Brassica carinata]|uniref:Uncharacterized protein n=1 Tax=Brassica oleracea TaxID=3712 RepID=A0A3P6DN17_BRAOL|nr:unnamed protein product [Brassica oleracea]